jgi:hypothetical protein
LTVLSGPANSDDPRAGASYRAMKAVVIILGILIVLALIALVVGAGMKLAGAHRAAAESTEALTIPPGARITTIATSGNRLILGLHTSEGDEVDIVDTETGHLVIRIKSAPPDVPK